MQNNTEKTRMQVGDKVYTLKLEDFSGRELDVEAILQIDLQNIVGEMITWPVALNRFAYFKAEVDNLLRETIFDVKSFEAQLYFEHKKKLINDGEKATETAIDMSIKRDPKYIKKKEQEFKIQKYADQIDGLYWSAKSKDKKLDSISAKIRAEDFATDILEGSINGVNIKSQKALFKNTQ